MNSFLIISKIQKLRDTKAMEIINNKNISLFNINIIDQEGSIGVEIVRTIQKTLFFTPVNGKYKAVIIKNAQNLTVEAQNALLKLLEEPPIHAYIILNADSLQNFLTTVLSRCSIITLKDKKLNSEDTKLQVDNALLQLINSSLIQKLSLAQTIGKDKTSSLNWLENNIVSLHEKLIHLEDISDTYIYSQLITLLHQTFVLIQTTNVNPRFILENLFLQL